MTAASEGTVRGRLKNRRSGCIILQAKNMEALVMKRFWLAILLMAVLLLGMTVVMAENDGDFEYTVRDGKATITAYKGADTVVACDGKILGKPESEEDALKMLTLLQGRTHQVYTGVTILYGGRGERKRKTFHECTDVTCYPVSREEILEYIRTGEPMDKAGAYGIQGLWGIYVQKICGDYNNVVGLPAARLIHEAKKLGIDLRNSGKENTSC